MSMFASSFAPARTRGAKNGQAWPGRPGEVAAGDTVLRLTRRMALFARAIANAKAICTEHFASNHELEIVDVQWHARRAMADGIIVTPTLLRLRPVPVQRLIGDLSDTARVLLTLSSI